MASIVIAIASLSGGGAERVAVRLAERWSDDGHQVCLITLSSGSDDIYRPSQRVERIALDVMAVSRSPADGLINGIRRVRALRRVLKARRPDIVLAMMTATNVLVSLAHIGIDGALILAERNYPPRATRSRVWSALRWGVYYVADVVLALEGTGRLWLERHTLARRVESIPNAVVWPIPRLEPSLDPSETFPETSLRRMLAVGRLVPQKGFDRLLRAFAAQMEEADARGERWHLAILGDGPERVPLERLVDDLGLLGRVTLTGRAGNVGDWYDAADLYVLSSRHEGFPGALLEAMASGCAVLAVDCRTGPGAIIENGVDGALVDDDDEALVRGLALMMRDEALRRKVAAAAPRVKERYGEQEVMALWSALFASMGVSPVSRRLDRREEGR